MFGSFNPESFENKEHDPQHVNFEEVVEEKRKESLDELFEGRIPSSRKLTGGDYGKLFALAMEAGVTDQEFKKYLADEKILLDSGVPDERPSSAIEIR